MIKSFQKNFSILIAIFIALLIPFGVYSNWAVSTVQNQDQFINSLTQFSKNSKIKELLATSITSYVDELEISDTINENVPTSSALLGEVLERNVKNILKDLITQIIYGPGYEIIWAEVSRSLHMEIVKLIENEADGFLRVKPEGLFITSEPIKEKLLLLLDNNPQIFFISANLIASEAPKFQIIEADELDQILFVWKLGKFINDYAWLVLVVLFLLLLYFQKSITQSGIFLGLAVLIGGLISLILSFFVTAYFQRKINETFVEEIISAFILNGTKAVLPSIYLVISVGILIVLGFSIVRSVKLKKLNSL